MANKTQRVEHAYQAEAALRDTEDGDAGDHEAITLLKFLLGTNVIVAMINKFINLPFNMRGKISF